MRQSASMNHPPGAMAGAAVLESFFGKALHPVLALDPQGRLLYANQLFLELLDLSSRPRAGSDPMENLVCARDAFERDQALALRELVLDPGRFSSVELEHPGGIWVLWSVSSLDGVCVEGGVLLTGADISRYKRREAAHLERLERLNGVMDAADEIIMLLKPDGTVVFANPALGRFLGCSPADVPGMNFFDKVPDGDRELLSRHISHLTRESPWAMLAHRVQSPSGLKRVSFSHRALGGEEGGVVEILAIGRDATDASRSREDLARALEEASRMVKTFESIFRSVPDGVLVVDRSMRVIVANRAMGEMIGARGLAGALAGEIFREDFALCVSVLEQATATEAPVEEYRFKVEEKVYVLNCSPLLDETGAVSGAVLMARDATRLAELEGRVYKEHSFRNIVGKSRAMRKVFSMIEQLAPLDTTVLITGESGTGKELVVDALHLAGPRARGPLIKVNCAALTESLLESELFGHVRGAFTGAVRDKVGRFEAADQGTLFLDEIGEISTSLQQKLLRAIERKEFERVGETRTRGADVRILAATNVDLKKKALRGEFRADLYYRLMVLGIELPPLRARIEDVPLLAAHFLGEFRDSFRKNIEAVSERAMEQLMAHAWPGNVRELRHVMEHACVVCPGGEIRPEHLPASLREGDGPVLIAQPEPEAEHFAPPRPRYKAPGHDEQRQEILAALERTKGNRAGAARLLGIGRATLYRRMNKLGLD